MIKKIKQTVKQLTQPENALLVIHPYYHQQSWVFDDEEKGLVKEPFVAGADDFIDYILSKMGKLTSGKKGFTLLFSQMPFMGQQHVLSYQKKAFGGSLYTVLSDPEFRNHEDVNQMWLCPALFKYFRKAPKKLYVQLKLKKA
ncbi:MAG: DUF6717 family protein [Flavobacteriales bacterium]